MSKTLYLITFLSALLLKSETSFGQELKKDLGVCGKTMGAIFGAENGTYKLAVTQIRDEEFCDEGRYEGHANFIIYLYNADKKLVYDKHVYLNPWTVAEAVDDKTGSFKKTKLKEHANSRIVKFPITKEMGVIDSYKIKSLSDKKETEIIKIKW